MYLKEFEREEHGGPNMHLAQSVNLIARDVILFR
jgi:hypothetical protein